PPDQRRQRFAPLRQDATTCLETGVGVLVDEDTVWREDVSVVVAIVGARVDAVRVAIDQLRDLLVVEGAERTLLRLHGSGSKRNSSGHERKQTRTSKLSNEFQVRHEVSMRHTHSRNCEVKFYD